MAAMHPRLRVAIVAASMRIIGGQAVQAQQLLDAWHRDGQISARLVPINPVAPWPFSALQRIKYVRTLITQACYWPLLFRELRRADIVHVFSASYSSFVLSPLPAIVVAKLYGKRVIVHYHSGEALDHLANWGALVHPWLKLADEIVVPSA